MTDTDSAAEPYLCPHCDAEHPHDHVDEHAVVESHRARLLRYSWLRIALCLAAIVGVSVLTPPLLLVIAIAATAWAVVTSIGLATATLVLARTASRVSGSVQERRFVLVSVIAGGALTPVAALGLAVWSPHLVTAGNLAIAVASAVGWFIGTASAEVVAQVSLRTLLAADTRAGEVARVNSVRLRAQPGDRRLLLTAVVTALAVGAHVLLCLWLPVLAVVLVPLHVAAFVLVARTHGR